jgi:hypothetical protein
VNGGSPLAPKEAYLGRPNQTSSGGLAGPSMGVPDWQRRHTSRKIQYLCKIVRFTPIASDHTQSYTNLTKRLISL